MSRIHQLPLASKNESVALHRCAKELALVLGVKRVVSFGSRVRGDFTGESDLDILVVISDLKAKAAAVHVCHEIELDLDVPLSPVIYTEKEYARNKALRNAFIANVEKEGVVLYDADDPGKD